MHRFWRISLQIALLLGLSASFLYPLLTALMPPVPSKGVLQWRLDKPHGLQTDEKGQVILNVQAESVSPIDETDNWRWVKPALKLNPGKSSACLLKAETGVSTPHLHAMTLQGKVHLQTALWQLDTETLVLDSLHQKAHSRASFVLQQAHMTTHGVGFEADLQRHTVHLLSQVQHTFAKSPAAHAESVVSVA